MKRSRRELSFNMVTDRFLFQDNQVTLSPSLPKTCIELPKAGFFYCVSLVPFERLSHSVNANNSQVKATENTF